VGRGDSNNGTAVVLLLLWCPRLRRGDPGWLERAREAGWDRWREQLSAAGDVSAHAEVSQQQEPWY